VCGISENENQDGAVIVTAAPICRGREDRRSDAAQQIGKPDGIDLAVLHRAKGESKL
jgi:hypothetical protein